MEKGKNKRITVKLKSPNPLFEKWLLEWRDKAADNNSKMQYTFNIALKSLRKYPIPLNSGKECLILKGLGNKLCDMLDQKLKTHKESTQNHDATVDYDYEENIPPKTKKTSKKVQKKSPKPQNKSPKPSETSKSPKTYIPTYRSGSYAILLTLLKMSQDPPYPEALTKAEIIQHARQYCDKSFTKPDPGSFYTAWSSMSTLITKKLVEKKSSPPKFNLTSEGFEVAFKLLGMEEKNGDENSDSQEKSEICSKNQSDNFEPYFKINEPNYSDNEPDCKNSSPVRHNTNIEIHDASLKSKRVLQQSGSSQNEPEIIKKKAKTKGKTDPVPSTSTQSQEEVSSSQSQIETVIFVPGTFDIILLVDNQETDGKKATELDDDTKYELNRTKIKYEIRHLKVGDFTWICRQRDTNHELVLPYIVERKRLDDLARSITDGRFHEQKIRLKNCGLNNLIYVIETIGRKTDKVGALPMTTLQQAAANTLVQDGFQVKFTNNHKHTLSYLATFSRFLSKYYNDKTIMSTTIEDITSHNLNDDLIPLLTFKEFNKSSSKQKDLTVKEMFIKQLVQLKGLSVDKAIAITDVFPTPRLLLNEFEKMDKKFAPMLLSKITYGPWKRTVGAVISRTLYQFYTQDQLL